MASQDELIDKSIPLVEVDPQPGEQLPEPATAIAAALPVIEQWLEFLSKQPDNSLTDVISGLQAMKTLLEKGATQISRSELADTFSRLCDAMSELGYLRDPSSQTEEGPTAPANRPRRISRFSYALLMWRYL